MKEAVEKVSCYGCLDNSYFLGTNLKLDVDDMGSKTRLMYKEITFVGYQQDFKIFEENRGPGPILSSKRQFEFVYMVMLCWVSS